VSRQLGQVDGQRTTTPVSLADFPISLGGWEGCDVPIAGSILKMLHSDDYLSRSYIKASANQGVRIFVSYTTRPSELFGHRPDRCYPANGWRRLEALKTTIRSAEGEEFPCLLHRFDKPAGGYETTVVLSFYVVEGRIVTDENEFRSLRYRVPNTGGNSGRYVAQVQIASAHEISVRDAAAIFALPLLRLFPDERGKAQSVATTGP
jgi:EpsI family protein